MHWRMLLERMLPGDRIRPMGDGYLKLVVDCMMCVTTVENSFSTEEGLQDRKYFGDNKLTRN